MCQLTKGMVMSVGLQVQLTLTETLRRTIHICGIWHISKSGLCSRTATLPLHHEDACILLLNLSQVCV